MLKGQSFRICRGIFCRLVEINCILLLILCTRSSMWSVESESLSESSEGVEAVEVVKYEVR